MPVTAPTLAQSQGHCVPCSRPVPIPYPKAIKVGGGTRDRFLEAWSHMGLGPTGVLEEVTPPLSACELCRMGVLEAAEWSADVCSLPSFTLGAG